MKKILSLAMVILLMATLTASASPSQPTEWNAPPVYNNLYAEAMVIVRCDYPTDRVTCMDGNGNLWQFTGIEDYYVGDIVAMIMDSKGTELIYDDEILLTRYAPMPTTKDIESLRVSIWD